MNVLQHTRNERNLFFKRDRADRYYRDCLLKALGSIGQFKRDIKKVSEISDSHTAIMY